MERDASPTFPSSLSPLALINNVSSAWDDYHSGWSPALKSSSLLPADRFLSPWSESRSISCDRVSPGADQVIISLGEKYKILLDHPSSFHFDPHMLQSAGISMSKCLLICSIEIMTKGMWRILLIKISEAQLCLFNSVISQQISLTLH